MLLSCTHLEIGYPSANKSLAHNINLLLDKGELFSILGANGCGKSTFLKTLSGLIESIKGNVFLKGKNISEYTPAALSYELSFVANEKNIAFNPNVFEYTSLGRIPYRAWHNKLSSKDRLQTIEALRLVNMENFANRKLSELSDGERQKVSIARALCQDTDIVLMDEPTAFLDVKNKFELMKLLRTLCDNQKKLIIFTTHDIDLALQFSDRMLIFSEQQAYFGYPEDLILNRHLEKLYQNEDIFFDTKELRFRIKEPNKQKWSIQNFAGDLQLQLTQNALRRLAQHPRVSKNLNKIRIKVFPNYWEVLLEDKKTQISSIEKLISGIKSYFLNEAN